MIFLIPGWKWSGKGELAGPIIISLTIMFFFLHRPCHTYIKFSKHGNNHFTLGTTCGGSDLKGQGRRILKSENESVLKNLLRLWTMLRLWICANTPAARVSLFMKIGSNRGVTYSLSCDFCTFYTLHISVVYLFHLQ